MNLKFCLPLLLAVLAIGLVQAQTARYEFEYGTVGEHMYAVYPDAESRDGASNGQVIMFASGDPGEQVSLPVQLQPGTYSVYIGYEQCKDSEPMGLTIGSNQEYRIELSEPSTTGCPGGDYVKREYLGDYVLSGTTDVVLKSLDGSRCSDFPTTMCWFMADYIDFEAKPVDTCGNGVCEPYESTESCPADCARQAVIDKLDFLEREVKKMPVSYFDKPSAVNKGRFLVALQMVEALFKIKKYQPALNIMECYIKNRSDTCTMAGDWFSPAGCGAQTNILQEIFDTISLMKQACPNCAEPDCFHFRFN